jgi:SAM-dependent methyltransferase
MLPREFEGIFQALSPQDQLVMQKFAEIEQQRAQESMTIRRYALEELAAGNPPTALIDVSPDVAPNLYEWHSQLNEAEFLKERLEGQVLDIGCGSTPELDGIVPPQNVTYVDVEDYARNFPNAKFVRGNIASLLQFPNSSFDTIYSSRLVYASTDISELLRLVRPTGILLIRPHGNDQDNVYGVLKSFQRAGVPLERSCNLTISETYRQHKVYPIKVDSSSMFIHLKMGGQ